MQKTLENGHSPIDEKEYPTNKVVESNSASVDIDLIV